MIEYTESNVGDPTVMGEIRKFYGECHLVLGFGEHRNNNMINYFIVTLNQSGKIRDLCHREDGPAVEPLNKSYAESLYYFYNRYIFEGEQKHRELVEKSLGRITP